MREWAHKVPGLSGDRPILRIVASPGAAEVTEYTGPDLITAANALLADRRIAEDSRVVLLLLPHSPELFLLHLGLVLNGKVPAILPWPTTRVDAEKYQRNLLYQLSSLPAHHLITLPRLTENLRPSLPYPVSGCSIARAAQFERVFTNRLDAEACIHRDVPHPGLPPDTLFLQFSGGTTGAQKCVVVTEAMLETQLTRLATALRPSRDDCIVSWLPMYHDMGLIACLWFPLWAGIPSIQFAANDWLLRPELLFELIEQYGGSMCWLPNFAFSYLAQRRASMKGRYALDRVRAWINCSEPVRRKSLIAFADAFTDCGVSRECLHASYAMAENVFAVTQTDLQKLPGQVARARVQDSTIRLDENAFELIDDVYFSSGRCLPEMRTRVVGARGSECAERETGEIQLLTPCLFQGYWSRDGFRRDGFTSDGWYSTGDYGFFSDGELYVIGRMKDIIIVGGQNIFPEDLEVIAARVTGVCAGRVVAFGVDDEEAGTQTIGVVAEMADEFNPDGASAIEREIRNLIKASLSVAPRYVRVVPQRWIVKSTAGKISRKDTRDRFLAEQNSSTIETVGDQRES
jgi:acyl-CoA synthetase (AMP-forming)/AMP-acid ligase II